MKRSLPGNEQVFPSCGKFFENNISIMGYLLDFSRYNVQ